MNELLRYVQDHTTIIAKTAQANKVEAIKKLRMMFDLEGCRILSVPDQFIPPSNNGPLLGLWEAKNLVEISIDRYELAELRARGY